VADDTVTSPQSLGSECRGCGVLKNSVGKVLAENFALESAINGCLEIGIDLPSFGDPKTDFFNTHTAVINNNPNREARDCHHMRAG
jgi:hypothetical protein